jgi:flagellar biogenesis protein FliO
VGILVLAAGCAAGVAAETAAPGGSAPSFDAGLSALRMLGALAVVLALFLGGAWLFRNGHMMGLRRGPAPKLQVVETRSLGGRQALHVVRYESQVMLIAAAPSGISFLANLQADAPGVEPAPTFSASLAQAMAGK